MIQKLKNLHDSTPIPDNLDFKINQAIEKGKEKNRKSEIKKVKKFRNYKIILPIASCFLMFIALINMSPAFAESMMEIPVLNKLCNIFTLKEYDKEDKAKIVTVKIPNIENTGNNELENRLNRQIMEIIQREVEESEKKAVEYRNAFLATGGKEEDFMPTFISVDYEIKCLNEKYASFIVFKDECMVSSYSSYYYYNIDLESGKELSLKEIIGSQYKDLIYDEVVDGIKKLDEEKKFYIFDDINLYEMINEDTAFYLNDKGNIVIVFEKYEIAAGAGGKYEFETNINISDYSY